MTPQSSEPATSPLIELTEDELQEIVSGAVDEAVEVSVNIALADYDKKHRAELDAWKTATAVSILVALFAGTLAALK